MKLLPVACLCLLTLSADANEPEVVKEDSDVILPCSLSTKENIESALFDWKKAAQKDERRKEVFVYKAGKFYGHGEEGQSEQFKGRVFHFPGELKHGNASIIIKKAEIRDSGNYTCDFPLLQPRQTFKIELTVSASPKPRFKILYETNDWAHLQCEVEGAFPKPEVEWKDSSGNKLPAEETTTERNGKFYVTLKTTVYETGNYSCVSTQETIYHQIEDQTFVGIGAAGPTESGSHTGWIVAAVLVALLVAVVILAVLREKGCIPLKRKNGSQTRRDGGEAEQLNGQDAKPSVSNTDELT